MVVEKLITADGEIEENEFTVDLARLNRLRVGIEELIDICAANDVDIPEHIKKCLVEEIETTRLATQAQILSDRKHQRQSIQESSGLLAEMRELLAKVRSQVPLIDVRVKNGSYTVTNYVNDDLTFKKKGEVDETVKRRAKQKIKTVRTESPLFKLVHCLLKCIIKGDIRPRKEVKVIMQGVDLYLESGKMYLVLGAPGSGKSTLLKMIANTLHTSTDHVPEGEVTVCGLTPTKEIVWTNLVGYIDQIDRLHPFLTVYETCEFAWRCYSGGTHATEYMGEGPEVDETIALLDRTMFLINKLLEALGLARVKDTFVGDQTRVRGVSGGEKKRVTLAEILVLRKPVLCCDEISTGLDAATTFDITRLMGMTTRMTNTVKVVSLLQPPPETVANFDDLILLSEGKIIYSGPVDDVIPYFNSLGYDIPERMDVADWLQALPTKDGWQYLKEAKLGEVDKETLSKLHLSTDFQKKFYESSLGKSIRERLDAPHADTPPSVKAAAICRYKNSWLESVKLLSKRELTLWWRDSYQIKAKIARTFIMGTLFGTLYFQGTDTPSNVISVLFQTLFFNLIGGMVAVMKQFPDRSIFYKHQDSNLFPTSAYVIGRSVAAVPNALIDAVVFGSMIYFLVGLAYDDGATIASYFRFMLLLFMISMTSGLFFSMFATSVKTVTEGLAAMALTCVMFVLFSGFTVQPDVIPNYYIWIYYSNYCSWALRGFVVNEFQSGKYDEIPNGSNLTVGEQRLIVFGFKRDGEAYSGEWAWWGILFMVGTCLYSVILSVYFLNNIRYATGQSLLTDAGDDDIGEISEEDKISIPFKRVNLTFKDIRYTVQSSITKETLELLKGVDGVIESGKMTALMGSSGAGKTTLMDVLALRKNTGEVTGEVTLNGHPQEEISFRRCMGYVEQFDTQTPQLTIRETMEFSARLRLDENDPCVNPEAIEKMINQTLHMLELTNIQDLQVGSDAEGGLSFEQRKRLSIAIELVANPSIIFLDEPTSGLDARAAAIVMRGLKRIAEAGRAVCATIHQPSVAIFNDFDSLLLLKRGGEVVFFGDLGHDSSNLIHYFERYDATPRIQPGENPATWMLTTIGAGNATSKTKPFDYAGYYAQSDLRKKCLKKIQNICDGRSPENQIKFSSIFATSMSTQSAAVFSRAMKIYFRSPSYNVTRVLVSAVVAILFSSVYASQRVPKSESDMNSRINSIYIASLFLFVNAQNTVLGVFECERNMFYRHKAAGMYQPLAVAKAFTLAEIPFIFATASMFVLIFYFVMGFSTEPDKFFLFYLFSFLGLALFTYLGQMFVSLFRDAETAQGFGGLVVSLTSMFSGILIRPSNIPPFWIFMYWVTPGHYVYEGIFMSQYDGDDTVITATPGSTFFKKLNCTFGSTCEGTAEQWVDTLFEDWSTDNIKWNVIFLVALIIVTRLTTLYALSNFDYRSN